MNRTVKRGGLSVTFVSALLLLFLLLTLSFSFHSSTTNAEEVVITGEANTLSKEQVVLTTYQGTVTSTFAAQQQLTSVNICSCDSFANTVRITNTGTLHDTYTVQPVGEYASLTTVAPMVFELAPGETKEISQYTRVPCDFQGSFTVQLAVRSRYNGERLLEQTVSANICPNVGLSAAQNTFSTCPCTPTAYATTITNTATYTDTFNIYVEGVDPASYRLTAYTVTLLPGETKQVFLYVKQPCDIYGSFDFTITTQSQSTNTLTKYPLHLDVLQVCYTYDVVLSDAITFNLNEPFVDASFNQAEAYDYELCADTANLILVKVRNPSDIINQYNVLLDAKAFASVTPNTLLLTPGQEEIVNMVLTPTANDVGQYIFSIDVNAIRGDLHTVVPFSVTINDCNAMLKDNKALLFWVMGAGLLLLLVLLTLGIYLLKKKKAGEEAGAGVGKEAKKTGGLRKKFSALSPHLKWLIPMLAALLLITAALGWFTYPIIKENYEQATAVNAGDIPDTPSIASQQTLLPWYLDLLILAALLALCFLIPWKRKQMLAWLKKKVKDWKEKRRRKKAKDARKETKKEKLGKRISNFFTSVGTSIASAAKKIATNKPLRSFLKWFGIILLCALALAALGAGVYYGAQYYKDLQIEKAKYVNEEQKDLVDQLKQQVEDLNGQITTLEDNLQTLEQQPPIPEEVKNQLAQLELDVESLGQQLAEQDINASQTAEQIAQHISEIQDDLGAMNNELSILKQQEEEQAKAQEQTDQQQSEKIVALELEIQSINNQLKEREQQQAALEAELLKKVEEALNGSQEAEAKISELDEQLTTVENEIAALESKQKELQNQLDALEGRVTVVENDVDDLKNRVTAIEEALQKLLIRVVKVEERQSPFESLLNRIIKENEGVKKELEDVRDRLNAQEEQILPKNFKSIVALDVSLSTLKPEYYGATQRINLIKKEAQRYILGDKVTIMVVGSNPIVIRKDVSGYAARRIVHDLKPVDTMTNIERTLRKADQLMGNSPGRIVVISDFIKTTGDDPYHVKKELETEGREIEFVNVDDLVEEFIAEEEFKTKPVFVVEPAEEQEIQEITEEQVKETEATPEASQEQSVETAGTQPEIEGQEQPQPSQEYFIEIPKNGELMVDLNKYFKDQDNDQLTFTLSPQTFENIDATLEDGKVTFVPKEDFMGEEAVTITADDGEGGVTTSPPIKLKVVESPASQQKKWYEWSSNDLKKLIPLIVTIMFVVVLYQITKPRKETSGKLE